VLESNNPSLLPADDPRRVSAASSDILDPPRFTYTHCRTVNNRVVADHESSEVSHRPRPQCSNVPALFLQLISLHFPLTGDRSSWVTLPPR
jgi:hypothetical protein